MALSLAASVALYVTPTLSFNSNISLDAAKFSQFVPTTEYSDKIDVVGSLGTDTIHVGLKFSLDIAGITQVMDGNRDKINEHLVANNLTDALAILHEPVNIITEITIRSVIKETIKTEMTKQVEEAKASYTTSTAQEIMDEVGMDDQYFSSFAFAFYDAANRDDATIDTVSKVLFDQIGEALKEAESNGAPIETAGYVEDKQDEIKTNLLDIFNQLKLVKDSATGKLKKISDIAYIYLTDYLRTELQSKVADPSSLEQGSTETYTAYSDRLLTTFVTTQMPAEFYQWVGYVSLGLFIGLFVFTATWVFLFVFTLIKTFTKKPWTFFGPWFWIVGLLQLFLGVGITVLGKFVLPNIQFSATGLPLKQVILAPRTYALVPSMIFLACFVIAIIYAIFKGILKKQVKEESMGA